MRLGKRQRKFLELVRAGRVQFCGLTWYPIIDGEYVFGRYRTMWTLMKRNIIHVEDHPLDKIPRASQSRMYVVEDTQKELMRAITKARREIKHLIAA